MIDEEDNTGCGRYRFSYGKEEMINAEMGLYLQFDVVDGTLRIVQDWYISTWTTGSGV